MTEVLYSPAFSQDYAYLGMPKRKSSAFGLPHSSGDEAQDYGILDERLLFKDHTFMSTPRSSQQYHLQIYEDDHSIPFPFSGVSTSSIPAGYVEPFLSSDDQTLHNFQSDDYSMSPNSLTIGGVPMQAQLSHDSVQYYHTPMSSAGGSDSTLSQAQTISEPYNFSGALSSSSSSYTHLQSSSETKLYPSEIASALQTLAPNSKENKTKRQFTKATEAAYTCDIPNCGKHFKRIWNYKAHQETHNPERPKPYQCSFPSCGKSFVRKTDRERHETCVHSKKKEFKCHLCNSMFARKDTLRRHEDDGCSKRSGFPKTKPKKRRSPVIPNREPNPSIRSSSSSRNSSRKSSFVSRPPMEAQLLASRGIFKLDQ
ncbi:hypothetical protein ABW20_dc0109540 [Dactylellina cionopaga]|nr:hypothetical protein ABW20_dc0109540 [Dactylellina cionopaga]